MHHLCQNHLRCTAALSLLYALPSSVFAFAASTSSSSHAKLFGSSFWRPSSTFANTPHNSLLARPLFVMRGGQSSQSSSLDTTSTSTTSATRKMSNVQPAPKPLPSSPSPFSRPVKKVVVVGGTHGNEYTGVWVTKSIEKQRELYNNNHHTTKGGSSSSNGNNVGADNNNIFEAYPTLDISTLLGNPLAFQQNKRFVDTDLNREFSMEKLQRVQLQPPGNEEECDIEKEFCSGEQEQSQSQSGNNNMNGEEESLPHEALRAREIESLLGPKFATSESSSHNGATFENPSADMIIDLHTTTANMGISLIIPEGDPLVAAAASYVLHKCQQRFGGSNDNNDDDDGNTNTKVQCLMHALPSRKDRMNLSSCGKHGFTIEVGPVPQGVLRHDVVEQTEVAMRALLEFLHLHNLEVAERSKKGKKGDDDFNDKTGEEKSSSLLDQLHTLYPQGIVPCYRSAPAVRPGELSGKISWPNSPSNPNFPLCMIHKSVQDRDFEPLRVGDPLFVTLDGSAVPYDGSHGEEVYLIFVNEGGYYYASSGTGIGVAVRSQFDWQTGWFVVESDDEEGGVEEVVLEEKDSYE